MDKVLIITYYWPPSGGAGVQRWLKLSKYLSKLDFEPYVLTVHEDYASYMQKDESLLKDVDPRVKVFKTKSFEPINIYSKIVGKKNVPTAGFSNVDNDKLGQKLVNAIRSNFFIPDPRKGWNRYAVKKARELIEKEGIRTVITTSPPHSTQLIGLRLKKELGVHWIADLRDPWTDIYYYELLQHSSLSAMRDKNLEKEVLTQADKIVTVSEGFKKLFSVKSPGIKDKSEVIPNGFDAEDFNTITKEKNSILTICYTGTISDQYNLTSLIKALGHVQDQGVAFKLQIVGKISQGVEQEMRAHIQNFEMVGMVPHDEVVHYQSAADVLLLIIPDIEQAKGIVPGKLFEYMATGNPIICLGHADSDAANIIQKCRAGIAVDRKHTDEVVDFIKKQAQLFVSNQAPERNESLINKYTREFQAQEYASLIRTLESTADEKP